MKRLLLAAAVAVGSGLALADRAPPGPPHPPPPQAFEACKGRSEGDACTVILDDHKIEGICRSGPDGNGPPACAPKRPPERPPD